MKVSLASDHAGFFLKEELCSFLKERCTIINDHGVVSACSVDYSDYVPLVVNDVVNGDCTFGILICASGLGMCIMANRYAGIRAGLCYDIERVILARKHNNINVLCIGAEFLSAVKAKELVSVFMSTEFSGDNRHCRRLNKFNFLGEKVNDMLFKKKIHAVDPAVHEVLLEELSRQKENLQLIASENFASEAVLETQGSIFTNKYVEGYPAKRYYSGCEFVDKIERLAIERACLLFNCKYANVQPHSGSQANQAIFLALLKPGDTVLSLSLNSGGHLTHGALPNMSGKWFNIVHYEVNKDTYLIDMNEVAAIAKKSQPKLIIAGASAYSRVIDFMAFRQIADEVGAYLLADIAHYAGLIAGNAYPNPIEHAHIVTSTTHKTLRGPRGGIILSNVEEVMKKINSAIFPGLQGGAQMHSIAAKAVAFAEALTDDFKIYVRNIIKNSQSLSETLISEGFNVLSGGTESHMILIDLRNKGLKGNVSALTLEQSGITCNKNSVPFDTESPFITSGLRFGSAAETTRGLGEKEFKYVGKLIADVLHQKVSVDKTKAMVKELCALFPIYD